MIKLLEPDNCDGTTLLKYRGGARLAVFPGADPGQGDVDYVYVPYVSREGAQVQKTLLGDRRAVDLDMVCLPADERLYGHMNVTLTAVSELLFGGGRSDTQAASAPRTVTGMPPTFGSIKGALRRYYGALTNSRFLFMPADEGFPQAFSDDIKKCCVAPAEKCEELSPADRVFGPPAAGDAGGGFDAVARRGLLTGRIVNVPGFAQETLKLPNQHHPHLVDYTEPATDPIALNKKAHAAFARVNEAEELEACPRANATRIIGRRFPVAMVPCEGALNTKWTGYIPKSKELTLEIHFQQMPAVELGALCVLLNGTTLRVGGYKSFGYGKVKCNGLSVEAYPARVNGAEWTVDTLARRFGDELEEAYGQRDPVFVRYLKEMTGLEIPPP